jgi:hypothetical protein
MYNLIQQAPMSLSLFLPGRAVGFTIIALSFLITLFYLWTKQNVPIRLLPQVEAMKEAVGRCAEMGRPLVYTYGNPTQGMDYWTVAGLNLLRYTAEEAAKLGVQVVIPLSATPKALITHAVVKDIMKNTFVAAGTEEMYNEANFRLTGTDDSTWGLAITRILYEVRPAAHFWLGFVPFSTVIFGEVCRDIGQCIAIGSSFYLSQIAFTVISSDYTFIAQDLIAASAYVTKDPAQGGFLRNIDIIVLIMVGVITLASILLTAGINIVPWMSV